MWLADFKADKSFHHFCLSSSHNSYVTSSCKPIWAVFQITPSKWIIIQNECTDRSGRYTTWGELVPRFHFTHRLTNKYYAATSPWTKQFLCKAWSLSTTEACGERDCVNSVWIHQWDGSRTPIERLGQEKNRSRMKNISLYFNPFNF